jgi:REP element-mobilizing transposase RayT
MARPLRIEFEEALYHITARGNRRGRIFAGDADRVRFLEIVARSVPRFGVEMHAYVLLPNHFHLLARTKRANLSRWMHWVMVSYTVHSIVDTRKWDTFFKAVIRVCWWKGAAICWA